MFKIVDELKFWAAVTVTQPPATPGGDPVVQTFQAQFRALSRLEADALRQRITELASAETVDNQALAVAEFGFVVGWDGVVGSDDQPIAFGPQTFAAALANPWLCQALSKAYTAALTEAITGN